MSVPRKCQKAHQRKEEFVLRIRECLLPGFVDVAIQFLASDCSEAGVGRQDRSHYLIRSCIIDIGHCGCIYAAMSMMGSKRPCVGAASARPTTNTLGQEPPVLP